ncbi:MAG: S8 family serine peptidase [Actinobacteria bacterium]|nr:S8 family serine peptidase [Actinomycetota bacterium]
MSSAPATIVLVDAGAFDTAYAEVSTLAESTRIYTVLPFFLIDANDPGLASVADVPGVLGLVPGDELQLSMLAGLDRVAALCLGQVSEWAVGGVEEGEEYPFIPDEPVGKVAPTAVCAAANMSLTPDDDAFAETLPTDVINHATRTVADLTLPVVAAGNHHDTGFRFETVSPWAEPEWVFAVGATSDEAGEIEWPHSARGTAADPDVGPDILAWGKDATSENGFGTSFAVVLVSRMATLCRAWLWQLAANIERLAGRPYGVPLMGIAFVDREIAPFAPTPPRLRALPVLHATSPVLEQPKLQPTADAFKFRPAVDITRRLLVAAAAETSPKTATPLSAPSLTPERLQRFLDNLSLARLFEVAGVASEEVSRAEEPLFCAGTANELWTLLENLPVVWAWDVNTRTAYVHPVREADYARS